MLRYLFQLLFIAPFIKYVTSAKRVNIAFIPDCRSLFRKRNGEFISSSSPFTYLRSSTDDEFTSSSWEIHDDWENLAEQQQNENNVDISSYFQDPARDVARSIELEAEKQQEILGSLEMSVEDEYVSNTIDDIYAVNPDPNGPALYDTKESFDNYANSDNFMDDLGKEIGLLVRCNEVPDNMNVEEGRALPELKDEHKYDVQQLIVQKSLPIDKEDKSQYEATEFFSNAILEMFRSTSKFSKGLKKGESLVLTKEAAAKWMACCLGEAVGTYDRRVTATVAKFGTAGVINQDQFTQLYMEAATSDMLDDQESLIRREKMKRLKLVQPNFMNVWRDLENHGFIPPIVVERQRMQDKIDLEINTKEMEVSTYSTNFMDECEILEWGDNEHSSPRPSSRNKSSHELVELCTDNKTPKRLRDGDFIFIDEESCIGCNQCALQAPASFKMEPGGRARAFHQSNSPEVAVGISACPVSCMHRVSFPELTEMENGRDKGDGRTDHRHMRGHTPLNVAKGSSDMNHKSSWYHYLKQKCYMSKSCPQRGCYDCPNFARPGDNPYFKQLNQAAEKARAIDIMKSGEADLWRNAAEL